MQGKGLSQNETLKDKFSLLPQDSRLAGKTPEK